MYGFSRNKDYVDALSNLYYDNDLITKNNKQLANIIATHNFKRLTNIFLYKNKNELLRLKNTTFDDNGKINLKQLFINNDWKKGYNALKIAINKYEDIQNNNNEETKDDWINQEKLKIDKNSILHRDIKQLLPEERLKMFEKI